MSLLILQFILSLILSMLPQTKQEIENFNSTNIINQSDAILQYFQFKRVHVLTLIECTQDMEKFSLSDTFKYLNDNEMFINLFQHSKDFTNFHSNSSSYKVGFLLNLSSNCSEKLSLDILKIANQRHLFTPNRFWLIVNENSVENLAKQILDGIFIPPDGDVKLLIKHSQFWSIIDIYRLAKDQQIIAEKISNFNNKLKLKKDLKKFNIEIRKRKNLNGTSLRGGLVLAFPDIFTTIEDLKLRYLDTNSKSSYPIVVNLKEDLNFRFNSRQFDSYGWYINGTFNGVVGKFKQGELDFGLSAIFMRTDRIPIVDYTAEIFRIRSSIVFRQPPMSAVTNIFAMPFSNDVWIMIFVFLFLKSIILIINYFLSTYEHPMDTYDCFMFVWGSVCQQGFHIDIKSKSGRVVIFTSFMTSLFLFTSFSANIVALLQSHSNAIQSIDDLSNSRFKIGVQIGPYNAVYFRESTDRGTKRLYEKKIANKEEEVYMSAQDGMKNIRNGMFAFQVELHTAYQIISDTFHESQKCGIKELEAYKLPILSIPVSKHFPYKELFRQRLRWQRENGLMNREYRRWFSQKPQCEDKMGGFVSIGVTEIQYPLLIFIYGVLISVIILIMELVWFKFRPKFQKPSILEI